MQNVVKKQLGPASARPTAGGLVQRYTATRTLTEELCRTLTPEDMAIQSMADASPTKWHLAHTSWFFENFLLQPNVPEYKVFHPDFGYLFNSYYQSVGSMYPRPARGLLSRPGVAEILRYRQHVDAHISRLLVSRAGDPELAALLILGINHEQQHQELLLTDIKHLFSLNPLKPAWRALPAPPAAAPVPLRYMTQPEGLMPIGYSGDGFAFDNETPCHQTLVQTHAIATRPITNAEYLDFIRAGGYRRPELWLADGWATMREAGWDRPLYWSDDMGAEFTLGGMRALDLRAPVAHVSWYEADAFARWAGERLPTEAEWESLAAHQSIAGNLLASGLLQPAAAAGPGLTQLFGDVWEWTASPYQAYPGFRPLKGSLGEYNGKFMVNQFVLRGGSCATPVSHIRASYRNFFYPQQRWQFSGLRLARDA